MRTILTLLVAGFVAAADTPTISDAQRLAYRTMERDYYRVQLQIAALDAKGQELKQQIEREHARMTQACNGAFDDGVLGCKAKE